jgi:hypothetical protein
VIDGATAAAPAGQLDAVGAHVGQIALHPRVLVLANHHGGLIAPEVQDVAALFGAFLKQPG